MVFSQNVCTNMDLLCVLTWMCCLGSVSANLHKLRKSSSILNGKIRFMIQLQKWLGEKFKWDLCYRASRDGWSAQDFHSHCDNKGPTVVLVKANDCIFGGYTDQDWEGIRKIRVIYIDIKKFYIFWLRFSFILECISGQG